MLTTTLLGALAATAVLAASHLAAPRLRKLSGVPERAMGSFAGGLAVSYVFLHLLPEVATGNEAVGEALRDIVEPTPLFDLAIFAVALAGFVAFYGLERLAARARTGHGAEPGVWPYRVHLGAFCGYNFLITYTLELRVRTGVGFAILFTAAIGLHFVLVDRGLRNNYPRRFSAGGRYALVTALLLGWVSSAVLAPTSVLLVSLMTALLSGSILLNVFKEELPEEAESSFGWFLTGLAIYTVLLLLITVLGE